NLHERLELKIAARRGHALAGAFGLVVVLPLLLIRLRPRERVSDDVLDPHPRARVAQRTVALAAARAAARPLRILAERELDAGHRPFEGEVFGARLSPAQLDHVVLAA